MSDIKDWSPQAALNNNEAPNGFKELMPAGDVNNSAREVMAAVRRDWEQTHGILATTGSSNAYVLTYSVPPTTYYTGMTICFRANHANTGSSTLNINGLGPKSIRTNLSSALITGDILSGGVYIVVYDGSVFRIVNGGAGYARYA